MFTFTSASKHLLVLVFCGQARLAKLGFESFDDLLKAHESGKFISSSQSQPTFDFKKNFKSPKKKVAKKNSFASSFSDVLDL
jgi:hypothetical protein